VLIDSTGRTAEEVVEEVLARARASVARG
jgi:hypothetical protein